MHSISHAFFRWICQIENTSVVCTLESGIGVEQCINVGPGSGRQKEKIWGLELGKANSGRMK